MRPTSCMRVLTNGCFACLDRMMHPHARRAFEAPPPPRPEYEGSERRRWRDRSWPRYVHGGVEEDVRHGFRHVQIRDRDEPFLRAPPLRRGRALSCRPGCARTGHVALCAVVWGAAHAIERREPKPSKQRSARLCNRRCLNFPKLVQEDSRNEFLRKSSYTRQHPRRCSVCPENCRITRDNTEIGAHTSTVLESETSVPKAEFSIEHRRIRIGAPCRCNQASSDFAPG